MYCVLYLFVVVHGTSFVSTFSSGNEGKPQNWAILVSGSYEFRDYVDEANVCHAYQNLMARGIPQSNIILMIYDDVAYDKRNPNPGTLINQPNGTDVYHGVIKDYIGDDVNPQNFMKVLLGDPQLKAEGKKVLESGPNDNVFIYFSDHGGLKVISFPSSFLLASDLISTLKLMHEKKMYDKLLFYLDTCDSGSMFDDLLPKNISIYATTSASETELAWNCFCDVIKGACIASEYSFAWMVDTETRKNAGGETIGLQFQIVKDRTKSSYPKEYGDLSIRDMPLSTFLGPIDPPPKANPIKQCSVRVDKREVPLHLLKMKIARASDEERPKLQEKLDLMIKAREYAHQSVQSVVQHLCSKGLCKFSEYMIDRRSTPISRHDCVEKLTRSFDSHCFNLAKNPYTTKFLYAMANIAEGLEADHVEKKCSQVASELEEACRLIIPANRYEKIL